MDPSKGGSITPVDRGAVVSDLPPSPWADGVKGVESTELKPAAGADPLDSPSKPSLEDFAPVIRRLSAPGRAAMLEAIAADLEESVSGRDQKMLANARVLRIIAAKEKR